MKSSAILLVAALSLAACQKPPQTSNPPRTPAIDSLSAPRLGDTLITNDGSIWTFAATDTALYFTRKDHPYRVILAKTDARFLNGFQAFLDSNPGDSLTYYNLEIADVTGDRIPDSCISKVSLRNSEPFIEHIVMSGSRQIYYDTLGCANPSFDLWTDEASYQALKPHSAIYSASRRFGGFVGQVPDTASPEFSQFIDQHRDREAYWRSYVGNFKGHWIWYLAVVSPGGIIWAADSSKFIYYWGP